MMKNTFKRGFTLIELLVVIAIIGILASVVLASLNSARDKGSNAALKGALAQIRSQAEIFYDTGRTYDVMCANATVASILANAAANGVSGATVVAADATAGTATTVICHDAATTYVVAAPLKAAEGGNAYYCVDSAGTAKTTNTVVPANGTACP